MSAYDIVVPGSQKFLAAVMTAVSMACEGAQEQPEKFAKAG